MTHLCQLMLEDLRRRHYAESTIHTLTSFIVEHFAEYFHYPPDQPGLVIDESRESTPHSH